MSKKKMFFRTLKAGLDGLIAYYKTNDNFIDEIESNNGTETDITYSVNSYGSKNAVFNGVSSVVEIPNQSYLNFTDGLNDLPFTIGLTCNKVGGGSYMVINKRPNSVGGDNEFSINIDSLERPTLFIFSPNGASMRIRYNSAISLNTDYVFYWTYDGSKLNTGFNFYINGVKQTNISLINSGTYTGIVASNTPVVVGKNGFASSGFFDGEIGQINILNKELTETEVLDLTTKIQNNIPLI